MYKSLTMILTLLSAFILAGWGVGVLTGINVQDLNGREKLLALALVFSVFANFLYSWKASK